MQQRIKLKTLSFLILLYFVQGLPFGFQATALPIFLRQEGVSLTNIGLLGLLATPWLLKVLWAPWVDRFWFTGFGRRKSWIVPMQIALATTAAAAAWLDPHRALLPLLAAVLLMNLFAATMDIAVDGLAVDVLGEKDLGLGNAAQVVGYKLGILTGGGLLVWLSASIGFRGLLLSIAALVTSATAATLFWREAAATAEVAATEVAARPRMTMTEVLALVRRSLQASGAAWMLLAIGTYKLGEAMADAMFKPFVVDLGFSPAQIGLWFGTWGTVASLLGSVAGGLLATRLGVMRALGLTAAMRVVPLAVLAIVATGSASTTAVIAVSSAEHFFGGALTTAMFAFMMSKVDRAIGATHFTLFATIEVLGKSPGAWASGPLAEHLGYAAVFAAAALLSLAFLPLLARVRARADATP
jgi:MFS transporter, PAT family, beta-lactamase induction signal transducer AmpG